MSISKFNLKDWRILWLKGRRVSKADKQEIKEKLATLADDIEAAITYSKERSSKGNTTSVTIWLWDLPYTCDVCFSSGGSGEMEVYRLNTDRRSFDWVAELVNKKWDVIPSFTDDSYEKPERLSDTLQHTPE